MSDKELLELAAKSWMRECLISGMSPDNAAREMLHGKEFFNPLTDDGDALRLAVKLKLKIDVRAICIAVEPYMFNEYAETTFEYFKDDEVERLSATRRAIVRAAAAIGEEL